MGLLKGIDAIVIPFAKAMEEMLKTLIRIEKTLKTIETNTTEMRAILIRVESQLIQKLPSRPSDDLGMP